MSLDFLKTKKREAILGRGRGEESGGIKGKAQEEGKVESGYPEKASGMQT